MTESTTLRTPLGRSVKIVEQGTGTPVVFLHSGVGSAGEWKQVFSLWPDGSRLIAIDAYRDGTGPGESGRRNLDDYTDQVFAVADRVGGSVSLIGHTVIEGAGHMMPLTHPGPLTRALLDGLEP